MTLHIYEGEGDVNVWVADVPADWTDHEVEGLFRDLAANGCQTSARALLLVGRSWINMRAGLTSTRVYADH